MPDTLADKDTTWLAKFIQDILGQSPTTQTNYFSADQLDAYTLLRVLDQVEMSQQALEYLFKNTPYNYGGDTAWRGVSSFQNGYSEWDPLTTDAHRIWYRRQAGFVTVRGLIKTPNPNGTAVAFGNMFQLPAGYRPQRTGSSSAHHTWASASNDNFISMGIGEDGFIYPRSTPAAGSWVSVATTFSILP
jgi:hypothetical protein